MRQIKRNHALGAKKQAKNINNSDHDLDEDIAGILQARSTMAFVPKLPPLHFQLPQ